MAGFLKLLLLPIQLLMSPIKWFQNASMAARLALLAGVFQFILVLFATAAVLVAGEWTVLQLWWSPGKILALLALFIAVPVLVHRAVLLWCEPSIARWPDIASAWRAILDDLRRQDIELKDLPVFLVFGTDGDAVETALLNASPTPLVVSCSPGRGGPLHAYATHESVYICLSAVGQAARVIAQRQSSALNGSTTDWRLDESSRLETVCELVLQERSPFVPINGVLAILPVDLSQRSSKQTRELGNSIAADLQQLTRRLQVRAPATFLCTGLEQESGLSDFFSMLAAKQQPQVNADQTVSKPTGRESTRGSAFPVGIWPTPDHIASVAAHAVGPLTDEIAELLLDPSSTAKQWTRIRLLKMLCRLRLNGAAQLGELLQAIFAPDIPVEDAPLLSGVFTGAVSVNPEHQGFLRGVFSFMIEQQAELEWTERRILTDTRAARAASILIGIAVTLFASGCGLLWWKLVS